MSKAHLYRSVIAVATLAALCLAASPVRAATYTWTTSSGTAWSSSSNWSGSAVPGYTDVAQFAGTGYSGTLMLTLSSSLGGLWDSGSVPLTISSTGAGVLLTLMGTNSFDGGTYGIAMDSGAGSLTISAPLVLNASQTWLNNSASPLTVSGTISGAAALTTTGSGLITLSGNNTYTGATIVNGGTLALAGAVVSGGTAATLVPTSNLTINSGAVVTVNTGQGLWGTSSSQGSLTINGGLLTTLASANDAVDLGNVTLNGGTIASVGTGSSTWGNYAFQGSRTVNVTNNATINAAKISLSSSANGVTTFSLNTGTTLSITSILQNGGATGTGLTETGSGLLTLSGNNTYSGNTTVSGGTLAFTGNSNISGNNTITVGNSNTAALNISSGSFAIGNGQIYVGSGGVGVVNQSGGTVNIGSGGGQLLVANGGGNNGTYNLTSGLLYSTGTGLTSRGVMLGVNGGASGNREVAIFNLSGPAFLNMPGCELAVGRNDGATSYSTDTYQQTGGTAIVGYLSIGSLSGGTGDIALFSVLGGSFSAGTFQSPLVGGASSSGTISIGGTAQVTLPAFPGGVGATSTATLTMNGGTLNTLGSSANYFNGVAYAYAGSNGANFFVPSGGSIGVAQNFQNVAGQAGTLAMLGPGSMVLSGTDTYSGGTAINAGTLEFATTSAMPATGTVSVAANVTLGAAVGGPNQFSIAGSGSGSINGLLSGVGGQGARSPGPPTRCWASTPPTPAKPTPATSAASAPPQSPPSASTSWAATASRSPAIIPTPAARQSMPASWNSAPPAPCPPRAR